MIDHVLGRPSVKFRKYQVFTVLSLWSLYLYKGDTHGPPFIRRLSAWFSRRLTAWQTVVITMLWLYMTKNFGSMASLECPEPLANLYSRAYFRATWVTTALDAGFWTAMRIRPKWAREFLSMVFSVYYLFAAEQADEKVRKVRASLTVDHLRVSWNKPLTPYLKFITTLMRPRFMRHPPRAIRIPRPKASAYKEPVHAWLYFDGPLSDLKHHDKMVLDIPGGGFVAMSPRTHDDKLMAWAGTTGLPVLSLDYKKAPEYPYPYALNECYDVYHMLISSRGRVAGLSGESVPKIIISGDSAGGNLAVGGLLMIIQSSTSQARKWNGEVSLPLPESVVLIYPALDVNIGNWMTDEQMALINDRRDRKVNKPILSRKSDDYRKLDPMTPHHSDEELDDDEAQPPTSKNTAAANDSAVTIVPVSGATESLHKAAAHIPAASSQSASTPTPSKPKLMKTRLAMSSMISYFNDRVLTPEMMRAMIILYIGPHNRPDFSTDFFLSPLLAPDSLLIHFPKTYILTGERDPLVDDTVIFAGRLRQAHRARHLERQELGALKQSARFREDDVVEVALVPGASHGFLQFAGIYPEGWKYIYRCADWILDTFERGAAGDDDAPSEAATPLDGPSWPRRKSTIWDGQARHHRRKPTESSGDENDWPLEMSRINNPSTASPAKRSGAFGMENGSRAGERPQRRSIKARRQNRRKSLVSLASESDLLGRRMKGLAGGLMGHESEEAPPTP